MKNLSRLVLIAFAVILSNLMARGAAFSNETLNYVISYKWGLIHKDAGTARMTLLDKGDRYEIMLAGSSLPWVDKFYSVRDTLRSVIEKKKFRPAVYEKIAHEDGKLSHDRITYSYGGNVVGGHAVRIRTDKKGNTTQSEKQLTASGSVFDMLSVFYYLRTLDYSSMTEGQTLETTVFSGSKVETLTIRYVGKTWLKLRDKSRREAYQIKFHFTTAGKKKSSDDLDAWISVDAPHIPLQIVGSLPVGQVKCYYQP